MERIWTDKKSHSFLVGMWNDVATLEDSLKTLTKLNIVLACNPAIHKWVEELDTNKILHMSVYSTFIYNCQTIEAIRRPLNRWIHKQMLVHLCSGVLFSREKKKELSSHQMTLSKMHVAKERKLLWKGYTTQYIFPVIGHSRKGKTMWTVKR